MQWIEDEIAAYQRACAEWDRHVNGRPKMGIVAKLGGRKFLVAVLSLIGVVVASLTGVDIEPYKETIIGIIGTYLLGQGVADGLSKGATSSNPPQQ